MTLFRFLNNKTQCPHKIELYTHQGLFETEHRCVLDRGHPGMHATKQGHRWMTQDKARSKLENEGRS